MHNGVLLLPRVHYLLLLLLNMLSMPQQLKPRYTTIYLSPQKKYWQYKEIAMYSYQHRFKCKLHILVHPYICIIVIIPTWIQDFRKGVLIKISHIWLRKLTTGRHIQLVCKAHPACGACRGVQGYMPLKKTLQIWPTEIEFGRNFFE